MKKREPLMTLRYFESRLDQHDQFISTITDDLKLPAGEVYIDAVYFDLFTENCKKATCQYSAGTSVEDMTKTVDSALDAVFSYKAHPDSSIIFYPGPVDEYLNLLALLTWSISLPITQSRFNQLIDLIDAEGQRDGIVDLLISTRIPSRSISNKLFLSKLFTPLYDSGTHKTDKGITQFLSRWYNTCLKQTSTHDLHTLHGGDDSGFDGYWAWEVAGLTLALGLDDTAYRQMPYYPADLVAFARQS